MDHNLTDNPINLIEKTILGCMFSSPKLVDEVYVKEEYFTNSYNKMVFSLAILFYQKHKNLDIALFWQENHDSLGNNFIIYLDDIIASITTTTVFNDYQDRLFEIYRNNLIVKYVDKFSKKEIRQEQLFDYLEKIKNMNPNKKYEYLSEEEIYHIITKEDKQIKFRLTALSNTIRISEHDFVVIGARPGVGKTGFALNLLEDISKNYKCLYFNMEMSEQQILRRLISINSRVPMNDLINPSINQESLLKQAVKDISSRKLKIFTGVQTNDSIKNTIIRESKESHVVVFIDYIGLIAGFPNKSPYERTTNIVKDLRQQSLNFDCTIIGLAQLNRNSDKEDAPTYRDFKDSGEYEQSAVSAILLHNENADKKIEKRVEDLEIIVAKNRNGRTGHISATYDQNNQQIFEKAKYY